MKITRVTIRGFGCFRDRSFSFEDGLNTLYEENGFGKTTLIAFLRAMFYGFADETKKNPEERERNARRPWDGSEFGGTIDFQFEGGDYRLDKRFGVKPAEDRVTVTDLRTLQETDAFGNEVGRRAFGVDAATFLRTILFSEGDLTTFVDDAVREKTADPFGGSMELSRYREAADALHSAIVRLGNERKTGELAKLEARVSELNVAVSSLPAVEQQLDDAKKALRKEEERENELEAKAEEIRGKIRALSEFKEAERDVSRYEALEDDLWKRRDELTRAESAFPNGIPDEEAIGAVRRDVRAFRAESDLSKTERSENEAREYEALSERFSAEISDEERAELPEISESCQHIKEKIGSLHEKERRITELSAEKKKKQTRNMIVFGVLGGVVLLGAIALLVFGIAGKKPVLILSGVMVAVASAGLFSYLFAEKKKFARIAADSEKELAAVSELIRGHEAMAAEGQKTLEAFFARYGITYDRDRSTIELMRLFSEYDKMKALRERVDGRKENQRKAEEIEKRIIAFFDKYNIKIDCSYEDAIDRIQEKITKFEAAEQEFLNARKSKTLFASQHDVEALLKKKRPEFPESMEELTRAFDETDKNRRENEQRKRENISRIEALEERAETLAGNSEELSDALEKRAELRKKVEIYRKTETLLGRAKSSLQEKTADPLTKRFRENLSVILDRETDDFSLDGDGLAVEEVNESFRSAKLLSGGTRALVYFALRLAIADVAYPEEKPILIMDDPFQPLDREKTERALKLLEKTSERYQILYFTCHESRTVLK